MATKSANDRLTEQELAWIRAEDIASITEDIAAWERGDYDDLFYGNGAALAEARWPIGLPPGSNDGAPHSAQAQTFPSFPPPPDHPLPAPQSRPQQILDQMPPNHSGGSNEPEPEEPPADVGIRSCPPVPFAPQPSMGEELSARLPGGMLATLLDQLDETRLSSSDRLDVIAAWEKLSSWAAMRARLGAARLTEDTSLQLPIHVVSTYRTQSSTAGEEIAMRMGWSKARGREYVRSGRRFDSDLAPTAAAVLEGSIDMAKAESVSSALRDHHHDVTLPVQDRVLPRAANRPHHLVRRDLATAIAEVDPEDYAERCRQAARRRCVGRPRSLGDGLASIFAIMPVADAAALDGVLEAAARAARADGDERTIEQLRSDVLATLSHAALAAGAVSPEAFSAFIGTSPAPPDRATCNSSLGPPWVPPGSLPLPQQPALGIPETFLRPPATLPLTWHLSSPDVASARGLLPWRPVPDVLVHEWLSGAATRGELRPAWPADVGSAPLAMAPARLDPLPGCRPQVREPGMPQDTAPDAHITEPERHDPSVTNTSGGSLSGTKHSRGSLSGTKDSGGDLSGTNSSDANLSGDDLPSTSPHRWFRIGTIAGRPAQVNVTVPLSTLLGGDLPGEIPGLGPVPPEVARAVAAGGTWTRLVTDPISGTVLDVGRRQYTPPADMADHVRYRNPICVAPGCTHPSASSQLDHTVPAPDGPTAASNLAPLCTRHHLLKTHARYHLTQPTPGVVEWRTPTGKRYRRLPDGTTLRLDRAGQPIEGPEHFPVAPPPDPGEPPF